MLFLTSIASTIFSQVFDQPLRSQPREFDIACPICKCIKDVSNMCLYPKQKWKSIKCLPCGKYKTARQWLCSCAIPWHSCPIHASTGHACGLLQEKAKEKAQSSVVAINLHARHSTFDREGPLAPGPLAPQQSRGPLAPQPVLPVNGRFLGHPGGIKRNRDKGKPAAKRQTSSKRARLTLVSGIPRTFLLSSLATRFQSAIKSEPATQTLAFS